MYEHECPDREGRTRCPPQGGHFVTSNQGREQEGKLSNVWSVLCSGAACCATWKHNVKMLCSGLPFIAINTALKAQARQVWWRNARATRAHCRKRRRSSRSGCGRNLGRGSDTSGG